MTVGPLVGRWLSATGQDDPYPVYRQFHDLGPVLSVTDNMALVVGHAEAVSLLRDRRFLVEEDRYVDVISPQWRDHASRCLFQQSMLNVNGERHARLRRLISTAFTPERVDAMRPGIERRVRQLAAGLAARGAAVDFIEEFAYLLPVNVICDVLGIPEGDRSIFRQPVSHLADALDPGWIYADLAAADEAATELARYFRDLLAGRRAKPTNDLLGALIRLNDEAHEPVGLEVLVANAVLLLLAGFETSVGALGNGLMILCEHEELRAQLQTDPGLAPQFLAEVLRYDSPVQLTARRAATNVRLGAVDIAAGSSVIVALGAANRDPRRFDDPDTFRLGRPDASKLSFGSGRHFCLGARLARLEGEVAFALLPRLLPELRLAGAPVRLARTNLRGFARLPIASHPAKGVAGDGSA